MIIIINNLIKTLSEIAKQSMVFSGLLNGKYSIKSRKAVLSFGLVLILCFIEGRFRENREMFYIYMFLPQLLSFWFSVKHGKREAFFNMFSYIIVNITDIIAWNGLCILINGGLIEKNENTWLIISSEIYELMIISFIVFIWKKISRRNDSEIPSRVYLSDIVSMFIITLSSVFLAGGAFCLLGGIKINYDILGISMLISCVILTAMCYLQNILHNKVDYYREIKRKNEELENIKTKYYRSLEEENYRMHKIKHEYSRHMMAVRELCCSDDSEAYKYADTWLNNSVKPETAIDCGNKIVSILIASAYERASLKNIGFKWEGKVPENKNLSKNELCELIGNILDNAVDECERITANSYTYIKFMVNRNKLLIISENTCQNKNIGYNENMPSSKEGHHGYGMENMKAIVKKHYGNMEWWAEDNIFHIKIIIDI